MGCEQLEIGDGDGAWASWCRRHGIQPGTWTDRGCPVAVAAADAAVDADRASIQAQALREFACHDLHGVIPYSEIANGWYHNGLTDAQEEAGFWADRIERES
jgi:hypothetical protein